MKFNQILKRLSSLEPIEILTLAMFVLGIILITWNPTHPAGPPIR